MALQALDLCADGGLREVKLRRRFGETAVAADRNKRAQQLDRYIATSVPGIHLRSRVVYLVR
jgi:hypothetical protein